MTEEKPQERVEENELDQKVQDPIKKFEELVVKYGRMQNLHMFKSFHSPGFNRKHPSEVNTIRYVLDGNQVKVSCICGASLNLTDYTKLN